METRKNMLKIAAVILCGCLVGIWFVSPTNAVDKEYQIYPEYYVEGYKSDTVRVMDSYERLMGRYMSMVEDNVKGVRTDVGTVLKKLNSIDKKMDKLGARIGRIEKALKIPQPKPPKKTAVK